MPGSPTRAVSTHLYNMRYFPEAKQTAGVCAEIEAAAAHLPAAPLLTSVGLLLEQRWGGGGGGVKGGIDFSTHLITVASLTNENELLRPFVCEYEERWRLRRG